MQNITVADNVSSYLNFSSSENLQNFLTCGDQSGRNTYILVRNLLHKFNSSLESVFRREIDTKGNPINLTYLQELEALFLSFNDGSLYLVSNISDGNSDSTQSESSGKVELIGELDGGLACTAWSRDQTMLFLLTIQGKMLVMNPTWDVLHENDFPSGFVCDLANPVYVSWRSDNAHFAISYLEENASANLKRRVVRIFNYKLEEPRLGRNEDNSFVNGLHGDISWSSDHALIASGTSLPSRNRLQISFFETNGLRHRELILSNHTHESASVLLVSWNLTSELLLVVLQDSVNSCDKYVQIWKRDNYYWHCKQEILISTKSIKVLWDRSDRYCIHVWYTPLLEKNHMNSLIHQTIRFSMEYTVSDSMHMNTVATISGKNQVFLTPCELAVVPPPMTFLTLQATSQVNSIAFQPLQRNVPNESNVLRGVMTLSNNQLVKFQVKVHLPGMNQSKMTSLVSEVKEVVPCITCGVASDISSGVIQSTNVSLQWKENVSPVSRWRSLTLLHEDAIAAIADSVIGLENYLVIVSSSGVESYHPFVGEKRLSKLFSATSNDSLWILLSNGDVMKCLVNDDGTIKLSNHSSVPPNSTLKHIPTKGTIMNSVDLLLCHSNIGQLLLNGALLHPAVKSFSYHDELEVLVIATNGAAPQLLYAHVSELESVRGKSNADDIFTRSSSVDGNIAADQVMKRPLETGSTIITVVSSKDNVILQLPRGNLEAFSPRFLHLCRIRRLLDSSKAPKVDKALILMRKHRIDMNLLFDHNPSIFMNLDVMIESIRNINERLVNGKEGKSTAKTFGHDYWDLFLSSLEDVDCTSPRGKYPTPSYWKELIQWPLTMISSIPDAILQVEPGIKSLLQSESKINRACSCLRAALFIVMMNSDGTINFSHPLIKSVITSYARQNPADIESCLRLVQRVCLYDPKLPLAIVSGDAALNHTILVCDSDVELLYSTALGMYDLSLAYTVIQRGDSDPKYYSTLLASIAKMGDQNSVSVNSLSFSQKWAVDVHLGRWREALVSLVALSVQDFENGKMKLLDEASLVKAMYTDSFFPENSTNDNIIQQGLQSPLFTALRIIDRHKLHDFALDLWKNSESNSLILRVITHGRGWSLLKQQAEESFTNYASAKLGSAVLPPGYSRASVVHEETSTISEMLEIFMRFPVPLVDDALYVAVSRCDDLESRFNGLSMWQLALSLLSISSSSIRRKKWNNLVVSLILNPEAISLPPHASELINEMVSRLKQHSNPTLIAAAASILMMNQDNIEEAVELFVYAKEYDDAIKAAVVSSRFDLMETTILPALESGFEKTVDEIDSKKEELFSLLEKLRISREASFMLPLSEIVGDSALEAGVVLSSEISLLKDGMDPALYGEAILNSLKSTDGESNAHSEWTDSSTYSTTFSTLSEASNSSNLSLGSKSVGKFSHVAATSYNVPIVDPSTLRLGTKAASTTGSNFAESTLTSAHKMMERKEQKSIASALAVSKRIKRQLEKGKKKVGSYDDDEIICKSLNPLIPTQSSWINQVEKLGKSLVLAGMASKALTLRSKLENVIDSLKKVALPKERRNVLQEISEISMCEEGDEEAILKRLPQSLIKKLTVSEKDPVKILENLLK
jgi:IKI3 family